MVNRRNFIKYASSLVVGAAGALYLVREDILVVTLKKNVPRGEFDAKDFEQFAYDYTARLKQIGRLEKYRYKFMVLSVLSPLYYAGVFNLLTNRLERFEEYIVTKFIMSTDYFNSGRVGTAKYMGLYDPYIRPCSNIFSKRVVG